jgi:hypothetical protein
MGAARARSRCLDSEPASAAQQHVIDEGSGIAEPLLTRRIFEPRRSPATYLLPSPSPSLQARSASLRASAELIGGADAACAIAELVEITRSVARW